MIDEYVNRGNVNAGVAWAVVVALMVTGWVVILTTPHWQVGGMFAAMACASSALAAVLHIRCYAVRLAGLVRAARSIQDVEGPRPIRDL